MLPLALALLPAALGVPVFDGCEAGSGVSVPLLWSPTPPPALLTLLSCPLEGGLIEAGG